MANAASFRYSRPYEPHFDKLLASAAKSSLDPDREIDWAKPLDAKAYGLSPEWSTLYGTEMWNTLTEAQRITLTRHEVASILTAGVWFEALLQSMLLRAHYSSSYGEAEFRFALVEIADECRHSTMFSKAVEKLDTPFYRPRKIYHELGRMLRITATPGLAYGGILAAEEVLDIMQRDWMKDPRVTPLIQDASRIHVLEEARHMKYARIELRTELETMNARQRHMLALTTAVTAAVIVDALVSPQVYASVGLNTDEAKKVAFHNPHRREMLRLGSQRLMTFFDDIGLLTPEARVIYRRMAML